MYNSSNSFNNFTQDQYESVSVSRTFVASVFSWMFAALAITAIFAYYFSTSETFLNLMFTSSAGRVGMSTLGWVIMFAPLGFVLLMSFGYNRLSGTALTLLFIIYSIIMGMSLSFILQEIKLIHRTELSVNVDWIPNLSKYEWWNRKLTTIVSFLLIDIKKVSLYNESVLIIVVDWSSITFVLGSLRELGLWF